MYPLLKPRSSSDSMDMAEVTVLYSPYSLRPKSRSITGVKARDTTAPSPICT